MTNGTGGSSVDLLGIKGDWRLKSVRVLRLTTRVYN